MMNPMKNAPLSGLKVIEFAGIGPGPFAGMVFADLGADVILIERPPSQVSQEKQAERPFEFIHRGKRSLGLDLKNPESQQIAMKLVQDADALIEAFRPGVMERLGLGPDESLRNNPRLVYGRMTGWGQFGPLSQAAGHDPNYIALSGALWLGGSGSRPPTAPLTLAGDTGGGSMMLLMGMFAALLQAQKTGTGQVIDAAISDGSAYISSLLYSMHSGGQISDELGESWVDFGSPWHDTYECADGKYVTVCALEPKFYAELIERLELTGNPIFAGQWDKASWADGKREMASLFLTRTQAEWIDRLEGTDACFAPVMNLSEAKNHPHNAARKTFLDVDGVVQPALAPKFSAYDPVPGKIPLAGEHNDQILQELGVAESGDRTRVGDQSNVGDRTNA